MSKQSKYVNKSDRFNSYLSNSIPIAMVGVCIAAILAAGWYQYQDITNPIECKQHQIVTEITAVMYRSAVLKLDNGTSITVNQPTVKPGDTVCQTYGRRDDK